MRLTLFAGRLLFDDIPIADLSHLEPVTMARLADRLDEIDAHDDTTDDPNVDLSDLDVFEVVIDDALDRITGTFFDGPRLPDDHRAIKVVELDKVIAALKKEDVAFKGAEE